MATRYCGPGGNDGADGLSYANRKLTLNGLEDTPVEAGDVCYIAPGTYREQLTVDVSGTSGHLITYIADVTGEHTDGVGGVVRITGSDNDQTAARTTCIIANGKDYRTFRGFALDGITSTANIYLYGGSNDWIIEDFTFNGNAALEYGVSISGATPTNITVRRCIFRGSSGVIVSHSADTAASGVVIENCIMVACDYGVFCSNVNSVVIRNCVIYGCPDYPVNATSLASSTSITVNNCVIAHSYYGLYASAAGEITEDYNNIIGCQTARQNVSAGAHSTAYLTHFAPPLLLAGYVFPPAPFGALASWSPLRAIAGTSEAADDLYGVTRPTVAAHKSWGAVQYQPIAREVTTTYDSSAASLKLSDAGEVQFKVPTTNAETTISVQVYREADYAGTAPQMIVKQPGQADSTTTDAAAAGQWNELTDTLTPAASPGYVWVVLKSSNTATSGNYDTFFDALTVA
jgi:hypothetical protein